MVSKVVAAVRLMRPPQWVKNVFVLAALVFGVRLNEPGAIDAAMKAFAAFGIFCLLSSSVYALNDLMDYREDALHPTKKFRPVASGALSPTYAGIQSLVLGLAGIGLSLLLPRGFALTAMGYLLLNLFYSLFAKHKVLVDVILISIGFVIRALAGAQAIQVPVSAWLVVCTFTLCLFLGFGKRRCELAVLEAGGNAAQHRSTLSSYSLELLGNLLAVTGTMAVITFLLYTLDPNTPAPHSLVFTTPLVFYAVFRYAMVISQGERTGPSEILIHDRPFLITAILWVVLTLALVIFQDYGIEDYLPQLRYPGTPATLKSVSP